MESLNFQNSFVVLLICGLEFSPSVNIHWVGEFILKSFDFSSLIEQFLFFEANFRLEFINAPDLSVDGKILIPECGKFQFEFIELFWFLLAVDISFDEVGVWQFDFFIQNRELLISFDELCSKDISLVSDHIVIFLLFCFLLLCSLNDFLHMIDMILLIFDNFFVTLYLCFSSIFICFYFDILGFNFFVIFIKFD